MKDEFSWLNGVRSIVSGRMSSRRDLAMGPGRKAEYQIYSIILLAFFGGKVNAATRMMIFLAATNSSGREAMVLTKFLKSPEANTR